MARHGPEFVTVHEFFAGAGRQPKGRYEQIDGRLFLLQSERWTRS